MCRSRQRAVPHPPSRFPLRTCELFDAVPSVGSEFVNSPTTLVGAGSASNCRSASSHFAVNSTAEYQSQSINHRVSIVKESQGGPSEADWRPLGGVFKKKESWINERTKQCCLVSTLTLFAFWGLLLISASQHIFFYHVN